MIFEGGRRDGDQALLLLYKRLGLGSPSRRRTDELKAYGKSNFMIAGRVCKVSSRFFRALFERSVEL